MTMKTYVVEVPMHCTQVFTIKAASARAAERIVDEMDVTDWSDHQTDFNVNRRSKAKAWLDR